jgi:hypothetical protein
MIREIDRPKARRAAHSRPRSLIATLLMIGLAVMIVRDIVVRRFVGTAPTTPDVTERSR